MVLNQQPSNSRFNRKKESLISRLLVRIKQSSKKQKMVYGLTLVGVALLIVVLLYVYGQQKSENLKKVQNSCAFHQELLREASKNLKNEDRMRLESLVQQIEKFNDFETDPNCLIPLTAFYIYKGDEGKATKFFEKLQSSYADNKVNSYFVTKPSLVENYRVELEGIKIRAKEIKESVIYY